MGAKQCSGITQFVLENMNGAKGRLVKILKSIILFYFKHEHLSPHLDSNF
jgi:hypothetical protein